MTFAEFKIEVEEIYPFDFNELIIDDTVDKVDGILNRAIKKALSKYEKIETTTITGTTVIADAVSVVECIPALSTSDVSVFDLDPEYQIRRGIGKRKMSWRFETAEKKLYLGSGILNTTQSHTVKYVKDPAGLEIEDMTEEIYLSWAIDYAVALIKIAEGGRGAFVNLPSVGFDYDYPQMKSEGKEEKDKLEEDLEDMYFGLFAIRAT